MWIQILASDAECEFRACPKIILPIFVSHSLSNVRFLTRCIAFQCSLSLMQVCNELFMGDGSSSPKALHYLSHTFALVNKRLRSDKALSDSTIGIIVSLINQEQIRRNRTAAEIHICGLSRIVELRGGLDKLEAEGTVLLVLRICKYVHRISAFVTLHGSDGDSQAGHNLCSATWRADNVLPGPYAPSAQGPGEERPTS